MTLQIPTENFDWTPVSELSNRYHIVKSVIYTRLNALGVKTQKIGIRAYVTPEQLTELDALHEFIQGGGTTAEFLYHRGSGQD